VDYFEFPEEDYKEEYTKFEELFNLFSVWWCFTHTLASMVGIPVVIILGFIIQPQITLYILVPYLAWYMYDKNSSVIGKPNNSFRPFRHAWYWQGFRNYSKSKLIKTCDLDPTQNYILGFHPHGLLGSSVFINIHCNPEFEKAFPGLESSIATLPANVNYSNKFKVPFWRDYIIAMNINSCEREGITHRLLNGKKGKVLILVIGGGEEFVYMEKG
jgi:hypothetical protein